ncbi:M23 family metallopeptidase [Candidatus Micrarchaeota archaeon]|nr:M23 family metallopeptidase [Candidatus Micrarchaeota archaeon]
MENRAVLAAVFALVFSAAAASALTLPSCPGNHVCLFSGITLEPIKPTPTGTPYSTTSFTCPVNAPVTGAYGGEYVNLNGEKRVRQGVEIRLPEGTDVRAAASGKIIASGRTDLLGYGRYVTIRHATNPTVETTYGYLQTGPNPVEGTDVKKGEVIGKTGKSEANAFPSFYFELRRGGIAQRDVENICKTKATAPPAAALLPQTGACHFKSPVPGNYPALVGSHAGELRPTGSGGYRYHKGDDVGVASGTVATAACDGVVHTSWAEDVGGYGGEVVIQCDCRMNGKPVFARYGHLKRRDVIKGQRVSTSQAVGLTGGASSDPDRGSSRGAHLHFELRTGGDYGAFLLPTKYIS